MSYGAIVLAGGAGRRMGGVLKPLIRVGGEPMLSRVIKAVADAEPIVVVGPRELADHLPATVRLTREEPPGSGPVAAIAAGACLLGDVDWVAVTGGDLPFLTPDSLALLRQNAREAAVYVDDEGRRQSMVTVWRARALMRALGTGPSGLEQGKVPPSMKVLLNAVEVTDVAWRGADPPPWYDCDTPEELRQAEGWT